MADRGAESGLAFALINREAQRQELLGLEAAG
jgi:hypothetical protein